MLEDIGVVAKIVAGMPLCAHAAAPALSHSGPAKHVVAGHFPGNRRAMLSLIQQKGPSMGASEKVVE